MTAMDILIHHDRDAREFYGEDEQVDCACNGDRACDECVDGGLYDGPVVDAPLPDTVPHVSPEELALHALVHCEDEWECNICNPQPVCNGDCTACVETVRRGPF